MMIAKLAEETLVDEGYKICGGVRTEVA